MTLIPEKTAEDYLSLIEGWTDPWPALNITMHEGFVVIRDDLLKYGSKVRFVDYFVSTLHSDKKEFVFGGCPATGYAQISLPALTNKYGKKTVLFMAKRNPENLHPYQKKSLSLGADIRWVENGMLTVTLKRAKDYVAERPDERIGFPLGLEHETVIASIIKVARQLPEPKEFWTVGSSGTLNRGLQLAWPNADANVVSVGHKMKPEEIGRATHYRSELAFDKPVKKEDAPPFPSAPTYDAKAWKFVRQHASPGAYFWNVGG